MRNKKTYSLVVFLVLVSIILVLTWRDFANGQQSPVGQETPASRMFAEMAQTLQQRDLRVGYQFVGRVENVRDTAELLLSGPQYYLRIADREHELLTLAPIDDVLRTFLLREMISTIAVDDMIFELDVNGQRVNAVISMDGTRHGGVFLMVSRIESKNPDGEPSEEDGCERRVLSTDLFRRPAEHAEACCGASCLGNRIQNCRLESVQSGHSYFGYVELRPSSQDVPTPGRVENRTCRAYVGYTWGVRFRLPRLKFVDIPGLGGEGNLVPHVRCGT